MSKIDGFIEYRPAAYEGEQEFLFHRCTMEDYGFVTVMPFTIEFEVPDDFDPRQKMVEMLNAKKREVMAEFQKRLTEIDKQINKYTALEAA
jgi:hypothetical protein